MSVYLQACERVWACERCSALGQICAWRVYPPVAAACVCIVIQVCATRAEWVAEILPKLMSADVRKLSRGSGRKGHAGGEAGEAEADAKATGAGAGPQGPEVRRNDHKAVDAARARFLARKAQQVAGGGGKPGAKR